MALMEFELGQPAMLNIANEVMPVQEVSEFTGNFGKFEAVELAQDANDLKRAAGASYAKFDYKLTQDNYETEEYGAAMALDQRFMQSYKYVAGRDIEVFRMIAASMARDMLMLAQEKRVAAAIFNATTWTGAALTTGVTNEWDDATNATPSTDVKAAKEKIRARFGAIREQDLVAIMTSSVRDNLRVADDITQKVQYVRPTNQMDISDGDIARALGVGRLIIGEAFKPTHGQGASAPAFSRVWDDEYCMIAKLARPGLPTQSGMGLGLQFHWAEDGSQPMGLVETYFDDDVRAEIVRVRHQFAEKVLMSNAGHLLSNITS
jgi:hypothetical protein